MKKIKFIFLIFSIIFFSRSAYAKVQVSGTNRDTHPFILISKNASVPTSKFSVFSGRRIRILQFVFKFTGTGSYTSRQVVDNFLFLDKNKNGKVDKNDVEISNGFNFIRPNKILRVSNFKNKLYIPADKKLNFILVTKFGSKLESGKSYNLTLKSVKISPTSSISFHSGVKYPEIIFK